MEGFLENPLLFLCNLLDAILNPGIFFLFIVEVGFGIYCSGSLYRRTKEIQELTGESKRKQQSAQKSGKRKVTTTYEATKELDYNEYNDVFRPKYQNSLSKYNTFTLIIQLFPLLGILGTVAGLYIAMNTHDGTESLFAGEGLYAGVGFALSSTVLGIICAILFKVVDIFLSNAVNKIDDNMDRFEKSYGEACQEAQGNPGIVTTPSTTEDASARRGRWPC